MALCMEFFHLHLSYRASTWKAVIGVVAQPAVPLCGHSSQQSWPAYKTFFALGGVTGLLGK